MTLRQLLLIIACLLFLAAAVISYSPRLERHRHTVAFVGLFFFALAFLVRGAVDA